MLYYLGMALKHDFGPANVLTYLTVRAGGAALTAFLIAIVLGPGLIAWLRRLKVGQVIRRDHVEDLHALHEKKAGTPTMGGVIMVLAAVLALTLWGRFSNRLLIASVLVYAGLGIVGFIDDYIKLARKHNKGLSARAKFAGQIVVGLGFGVYLVLFPAAPDPTVLTPADILDWEAAGELARLAPSSGRDLEALEGTEGARRNELLRIANTYILERGKAAESPESHKAPPERRNRLVLEKRFPGVIAPSESNLATKLEVPFLKEVFVPLGAVYALFVLLVIVGASNAVNLTDGLDGLAIGASVISLLAYTAIAYVVSRADWSRYLLLVYVPEATEVAVFGAALVGAGLGFLWFNCHPAEVFMGDTGSLALGGALGAMAILTKQELLLVVVGGLFVLEAGSVILQVASFKTTGKRIFKMSPLHHHFELLGWSETKVVMRFWILAVLFGLASLGALKLR